MSTSDELINKLKNALQTDGDFPVSAKIVSDLRQITSDPRTTAEQITEVILREPSLGTRVLHFVNSAFSRRAKPILTVSQAVVQIGMKPLSELCSGLVLMQKFVPAARRSSPFAYCLRKSLLVSLISSALKQAISAQSSSKNSTETGYLIGQLAEMGGLLLAFYFPEVLEAAVKRSEQKNQDISESIRDITGLSPSRLSAEVVQALGLPKYYVDAIEAADEQIASTRKLDADTIATAKYLAASMQLGTCISSGKGKAELDQVLVKVQQNLGVSIEDLKKMISMLPQSFRDHCGSLELELPSLPDFIASYSQSDTETQVVEVECEEFESFVQEIKKMLQDREPTASIITSVMETIAYGLKFDRVFLSLVASGKQKLLGRMLLGQARSFDPKRFERDINDPINCPLLKAYKEGRPVYKGNPLFHEGWPIAAIPVGLGSRAIGVIYADRIPNEDGSTEDLSPRDHASISILADLLERSITSQAKG